VLIFALGLPDMFASLVEGDVVDNRVMVAGYVVMRAALVFQWLRAARQDPDRRAACLEYVKTLLVAQAGWVALLIAETFAERVKGGTPWHAHHIAERYGLLVIIALGEGLLGTAVAINALIAPEGPAGRSTSSSSGSPGRR
jgi:low temperature requirement protein LtrA